MSRLLDKHTDQHTDTHINTITGPGLGAGPSEMLSIENHLSGCFGRSSSPFRAGLCDPQIGLTLRHDPKFSKFSNMLFDQKDPVPVVPVARGGDTQKNHWTLQLID